MTLAILREREEDESQVEDQLLKVGRLFYSKFIIIIFFSRWGDLLERTACTRISPFTGENCNYCDIDVLGCEHRNDEHNDANDVQNDNKDNFQKRR